jgi:DNA-directed RNA polymerase specialized sigma24 family protein
MNAHTASPNSRERYEVFCLAITDRDPDALADVVAWYRPLLVAWARQRLARTPVEESCEDIADEAFARAWSALAATDLASFPSLAAVLGYLRACVASVVVDRARSHSSSPYPLTPTIVSSQPSPEQAVLAELNRAEIWSLVKRHIMTEHERIVVYESMVLCLPPRTILRRHPGVFDGVGAIYRIKRNLIERLRRDEALRRFWVE